MIRFCKHKSTELVKTKWLDLLLNNTAQLLQIKAERERERERERESYRYVRLSDKIVCEYVGKSTPQNNTFPTFVTVKCRILLLCLCCFPFFPAQAQIENQQVQTEIQSENNENPDPISIAAILDGNLLVKTNALYLGAGVANLGLEYSFSERLSIDFPIVYSPYTIKSNWKIRMFGMQPEIRIWADEQLSGHFAGLHAHLAWYNVAVDKLNRYQDKNGNTPLLGFGITYGYALRGKNNWDKWGLEFSLGAGIAQIEYDTFHNVRNGAPVENNKSKKTYWGITKIGISLSYKLISKKP